MTDALQMIVLFAVPALVLRAEDRFKLVQVLSPVVICYGVGIALANMPIVALNNNLSNQVAEAVVVLAIPMLLFPSDLRGFWKLAPATALSFALAIAAICVTSVAGSLLFSGRIESAWMVSAMLVGVYTGGTPNMTAIAMSLNVPEETFILVNAADLLMGSTYLFFLMTVAKPVLGKFYKPFPVAEAIPDHDYAHEDQTVLDAKSLITVFLLAAGVVGTSVGLSLLLLGKQSAPLIILSLTTLAIVASFSQRVRDLKGSYDFGQYLMLVFCLSIGAMADVNDLLNAMSTVLGYCAFVMFGSIAIHFLLARLCDIDVDTLIITTTASVFGPPFVGPIAKVLNNRAVVVGGMTAGVVGLAIGNYLGYAIGKLLQP